jgi:pimeloyl-ACP methyl ester carboxylesterase
MHSVGRFWSASPANPEQAPPWIDPTSQLSDRFRVIAMDQRNAGASRAPVRAGDGWPTYTADHIALLDDLGIERTHVMGGCIGCSYALGLCAAAPDRVASAVLQNPIGLTGTNRSDFFGMVDHWGRQLTAERGDVTPDAVGALRENMFGGDFVFSVSRDFVRSCTVPLLVLAGDDAFHPTAVAEEIVDLAPDAEMVRDWKGPAPHTLETVRRFLLDHTAA